MNKVPEWQSYLFEYWKNTYNNLCGYCSNNIECKGEECPKYENYGTKAVMLTSDGEDSSEYTFNYDITCMDINYGKCPMLENTPCDGCIENNNVGFAWNGEIPKDYNQL